MGGERGRDVREVSCGPKVQRQEAAVTGFRSKVDIRPIADINSTYPPMVG